MNGDFECQRCGTCCESGGPALHQEDLELVQSGKLPLRDLYTIRKGEMAHDNVKGTLAPVAAELIKIKGAGQAWTCCYYDAESKGCSIYANRPLECRVLNCRNTAAIEALYDQGRLTRKDLLDSVPELWDLVEAHEQKCNYPDLANLAARLREEQDRSATDKLVKMVSYDAHLRALIIEKGRPDPSLLDFLFGRPLSDTLPGFGLKITHSGNKLIVAPTKP